MSCDLARGTTLPQVTSDLPCVRCGYNLRSLSWDARCPECHTPVGQSRLLPGFRFASRREAFRLRTGLFLLVVSTLVAVSADIIFTLTCRYWLQIPGRTWQRASLYFWAHSPTIVAAVQFAAAWLIAWPRRGVPGNRHLALCVATFGLATLDLLVRLALSVSERPFGAGWTINVLGRIHLYAGLVDAGCRVWLTLLWVCLLARVDRKLDRRLSLAVIVATSATVLVLVGAAIGAAFGSIVAPPNTGALIQTNSAYIVLDVYRWWRKYVSASCWIVIMGVVWMYVRRLDAALRASSGRSEAS